jgi:hypothetical protein
MIQPIKLEPFHDTLASITTNKKPFLNYILIKKNYANGNRLPACFWDGKVERRQACMHFPKASPTPTPFSEGR